MNRRAATKERRRTAVEAVAVILNRYRASPFEFEAACRHGIRAHLCEDGWPWELADATAHRIVAAALERIGARRPSFEEGQPEWTQRGVLMIERTRCVRCGNQLPEPCDGREAQRKYCSPLCKSAAAMEKQRRDRRDELSARQRAYWASWKAKQPARECELCGAKFKPNRPKQRFCGTTCRSRHAASHMRRFGRINGSFA